MKKTITHLILILFLFSSCKSKENKNEPPASEKTPTQIILPNDDIRSSSRSNSSSSNDDDNLKKGNDDNDEDDDKKDKSNSDNDCGFDDETYSAAVKYYNPETGYDATYTLEVEVEDCQVVKINFPKGGYLDGHHINPTDIDDDGDSSVTDDEGRTYEVHIDK